MVNTSRNRNAITIYRSIPAPINMRHIGKIEAARRPCFISKIHETEETTAAFFQCLMIQAH